MSFHPSHLPPPYSPSTRPPPSPSQPPTPASYSRPPTPAYSCPPTPYSPYNHHPPSPMPAYNRPPPSPYPMPHTPNYSMPPPPFSPPPASPCPPTTTANPTNLICCTPSEEPETKTEKASNKQKWRSDARHHPYGRPGSKVVETGENDLRSQISRELTASENEVFERILEAAVQDPQAPHPAHPAPHHLPAASFRQPVDVKPHLPSLMDLPPNLPSQVKNPNMNPSSIIWDQQQFSEAGPRSQLAKREIVLDGLNIGKVYGRSKFSALGVEKTLAWFTTRGYKVSFQLSGCFCQRKLLIKWNPFRCEYLCQNPGRIERQRRPTRSG